MATLGNNCYLDANVLVYFIREDSPLHLPTQNLLKNLLESNFSLFISPLCLDEFIYHVSKDLSEISLGLKRILALPQLNIVNPPLDQTSQIKVLKYMSKFKLGPRDAYHLLITKHHKIKYFATFDHDFDLVFSSRTLKQFSSS